MPKLRSLFFAGLLGVFSFAEAQGAPPPTDKPKEPPALTLSSSLDPGWCSTVDGPTSLECIGAKAQVTATIAGEDKREELVLCVDGFELTTTKPVRGHGVNRFRFVLGKPVRCESSSKQAQTSGLPLCKVLSSIDTGAGHRAYLALKGKCGDLLGRRSTFVDVAVAATPHLGLRGAVSVFAFLVLGLFVLVWAKPGLLQDPKPEGEARPWSLGRVQLAWWTAIVFGTWVVIFVVTHNYQSLTQQALALLGVSVATTAAGAAEQARKERLKAEAEAAKNEKVSLMERKVGSLAETTAIAVRSQEIAALVTNAPSSQPHSSFLNDLLTDENGPSLPRLQAVIWTIVLGALFVWRVFANMAMPTFSTELLFLAGISSGTYLFGKFAERRV